MEASASKQSPLEPPRRWSRPSSQHRAAAPVPGTGSEFSRWHGALCVMASLRFLEAVRLAARGPSVGACRTARKPLAALGLGLAAALRVRSAPAVGAGLRLASHPTRPQGAKEDAMNRFTGTGHLTKDPKFLETDSAAAICSLRIAVRRGGKQGQDGYFDVKCFEAQ